MKIKGKKVRDVLVLSLSGELMGGEETKPLQEQIYKTIEDDQPNVVLDMKDLKWMNSSGLGIIMSFLTTLRGSDGDLRIAGASERVKRPIEVTKLDQVIKMFDTIDEAVKSYSTGGDNE
ncbi:MAG: STAS domain-containing protein [bacterium]